MEDIQNRLKHKFARTLSISDKLNRNDSHQSEVFQEKEETRIKKIVTIEIWDEIYELEQDLGMKYNEAILDRYNHPC